MACLYLQLVLSKLHVLVWTLFSTMWSLHLTMWWNHIDLHFGTKDYCNVICIIFMYKLFSFNKIKYSLTQFLLSKCTFPKFIFLSLKSKYQTTNLSLLTDIFLFDHIYVNYTNKLTLTCVFLLILSIFFSFSKHSHEFWIIFTLPIFVSKYPLIFLQYFQYIHKIQVSIYSCLLIFQTLRMTQKNVKNKSFISGLQTM